MENNIISDYSLDSFIKDNSINKSSGKYNYKDNEISNYAEIAEKYGFKEKTVKTITNKVKNPTEILLVDYIANPYLGCYQNKIYKRLANISRKYGMKNSMI